MTINLTLQTADNGLAEMDRGPGRAEGGGWAANLFQPEAAAITENEKKKSRKREKEAECGKDGDVGLQVESQSRARGRHRSNGGQRVTRRPCHSEEMS